MRMCATSVVTMMHTMSITSSLGQSGHVLIYLSMMHLTSHQHTAVRAQRVDVTVMQTRARQRHHVAVHAMHHVARDQSRLILV